MVGYVGWMIPPFTIDFRERLDSSILKMSAASTSEVLKSKSSWEPIAPLLPSPLLPPHPALTISTMCHDHHPCAVVVPTTVREWTPLSTPLHHHSNTSTPANQPRVHLDTIVLTPGGIGLSCLASSCLRR